MNEERTIIGQKPIFDEQDPDTGYASLIVLQGE